MKKRLSVFLLVFVLLLQLLPAGVMASDETQIIDPMYDDPMYGEYASQMEEAPILFAEEGAKKDTRVTFADFSTRALKNGETLHRGVDVSYYQKSIDWVAAANDGVEFAIIRGGYRGWGTKGTMAKDAKFSTYMRDALEAGVEVGVYIYSQATTVKEAQEEAKFLIDMVKGYDITLPLVLDFEFASIDPDGDGKYVTGGRLWDAYKDGKLDKKSAAEVCQAFCDTVEDAGYDSMVYVNPDMAKNYLDVTNLERVWLAHYTGTDEKYRDETTGKFPASYYAGDYEFWQCASKGKVAGISGNVDINFWFKPLPPREPFKDVEPDDWFYENVVYAYENKITSGITETTFAPNSNTTRGQLVTMLYRMAGEPEVTGETTFTDLTMNYYKNAVLWAYQNGIVNGRTETTFDPDADVTRQELATILYRYAVGTAASDETEEEGENPLAGFTDADKVSAYAKEPIIWAVEHGIINGMTATQLEPTGKATRAQIAAVIHRYMLLLETQNGALKEKLLGLTIDDSIRLGMEGTEEELRTLIEGVLEGTVTDKEPDDVVAGAANALYIYLLEHFDLAEEFLTADTWKLSADISGNYYLTAEWNEPAGTQRVKYDGETVSLVTE